MKFHALILALLVALLNCSGRKSPLPKENHTPQSDMPPLEEMVGEMIMLGVDGTGIDQNKSLKPFLSTGKIGGVILYEKNIAGQSSVATLRKFCGDLQKSSANYLFIGIDQEGGNVNRLKPKYGFPRSITAERIGKVNHTDTSEYYAKEMAYSLSYLGINVNFAPCVDLCSNPDNPVIARYGRCFSSDPEIVSKHAGIFIDAMLESDVMPVIKHFPGHGSSHGDTHLDMTDVTNYWKPGELIPYKKLLARKNRPAVMTAHIINATLDPDTLPATLSNKIIGGLLRDSLDYDGLVFSDDMQMKAISNYFGLEKAIELAINAGVDVLMFSGNIPDTETPTVETVHQAFLKLVNNKKITLERIYRSYLRIQEAKSKLKRG